MTRFKNAVLLLLCLVPAAGAFAQSQATTQTTTAKTNNVHIVQHPRQCGIDRLRKAMIARNPEWAQKFQAQKASLQANADYYKQYKAQVARGERKTDAISPIPIIFHIIVDSAQFKALGGTQGIIQRCDSQIAVLNADYNHQNADSTMIPSAWYDSLYGNAGISFGLAHVDPSGNCSPGYEVLIIPGTTINDAGFSNVNYSFPEAKTAGTGLAAWDVTKYYNVWCINFTGDAAGLLGLTVPLSFTGGFGGLPVDQEGVCMLYNTLGSIGHSNVIPAGTGNWYVTPDNYAWGRTLSHETGHMFEIWHPWGDDGPYGSAPYYSGEGYCPWAGVTPCSTTDTVIGSDDGLYDTPPESQANYGNPTYGVSVPGGTINDCCQYHDTTNTQPIGIACISFMDYVDDDAMHLLTPDQAAAVASMVLVSTPGGTGATGSGTIGENYSLTQNPNLLVPCTPTGVAPSPTEINSSLSIYPNPTNGEVHISVNSVAETLDNIVVLNLLGQEVMKVAGQGKDYYTLDLSGVSKGLYFIQCNFASGTVTRKVVLQ